MTINFILSQNIIISSDSVIKYYIHMYYGGMLETKVIIFE